MVRLTEGDWVEGEISIRAERPRMCFEDEKNICMTKNFQLTFSNVIYL